LGTVLINQFRSAITSSLTARGLPHAVASAQASKIAQLQGGNGNVAAIPAFIRADFAVATPGRLLPPPGDLPPDQWMGPAASRVRHQPLRAAHRTGPLTLR